MKKDKNRYPKGWTAASIKALADHYDNQTPEQAAAEDDAAWRDESMTIMLIPRALVPAVRKLLAKRKGTRAA